MNISYAGLRMRTVAFALDYLIIAAYLVLLGLMSLMVNLASPGLLAALFANQLSAHISTFLLVTLPVILYFALLEASSWQATWGKRKLNLRVVRTDGARLSASRALARTVLTFLPWELAHTLIWQIRFVPAISAALSPAGSSWSGCWSAPISRAWRYPRPIRASPVGWFVSPAIVSALQRNPAALAAGEWWRLITPLFVHPDGWSQIIVDFAGIAIVGPIVERRFGSARWLALYFVAGLSAEIISYAWEPSGAGSSIALCGLIGGLFADLIGRQRLVWPIALMYETRPKRGLGILRTQPSFPDASGRPTACRTRSTRHDQSAPRRPQSLFSIDYGPPLAACQSNGRQFCTHSAPDVCRPLFGRQSRRSAWIGPLAWPCSLNTVMIYTEPSPSDLAQRMEQVKAWVDPDGNEGNQRHER